MHTSHLKSRNRGARFYPQRYSFSFLGPGGAAARAPEVATLFQKRGRDHFRERIVGLRSGGVVHQLDHAYTNDLTLHAIEILCYGLE